MHKLLSSQLIRWLGITSQWQYSANTHWIKIMLVSDWNCLPEEVESELILDYLNTELSSGRYYTWFPMEVQRYYCGMELPPWEYRTKSNIYVCPLVYTDGRLLVAQFQTKHLIDKYSRPRLVVLSQRDVSVIRKSPTDWEDTGICLNAGMRLHVLVQGCWILATQRSLQGWWRDETLPE